MRNKSLIVLAVACPLIGMNATPDHQAALSAFAAEAPATREAISIRDNSWPTFRGRPTSTGVAAGELPQKLQLLWKFSAAEGGPFRASPVIAGGRVYIGQEGGDFHAIDLDSGKARWKLGTGSAIEGSAGVRDGQVFVGNQAGTVYGLSVADGSKKWTLKLTEKEIYSSPNFYGDRILLGSDGGLSCLGANGQHLWTLPTKSPIYGQPTIVGSKGLFTCCDKQLHMVDLETGEQLAAVDLGDHALATPVVQGRLAYVANFMGKVFCVDWIGGEVKWTFQDPQTRGHAHGSAAVSEGVCVFGSPSSSLVALDAATGQVLWQVPTVGQVHGSPVVVNQRVFVADESGRLYSFDLKSGRELWRYDGGGKFRSSPAVAEGRLVIANIEGEVLCFGSGPSR